jgi:nitrogenase molybdenum-iron protein beta chain
MSVHVESPRNACALIGALQTIQAIEGFVPIIHSTAGCALQQYLGGSVAGGGVGAGLAEGATVSSSNISEKHVVFGGSSRLREQIKNTVKVLKGDLCSPDRLRHMVGDDIPAMAKEAREQGLPVIHANTRIQGWCAPGV